MCSNKTETTTTSQYNEDLETYISKYQVSSNVLEQLQEEGFNTELIKPERRPTFDDLLDQLMSIGETKPIQHSTTQYSFKLTLLNWINWLTEFKSYMLHTNVLDPRILELQDITSYNHLENVRKNATLGNVHSEMYIKTIAMYLLGKKCNLFVDYNYQKYSQIIELLYDVSDDTTGEKQNEARNICLEICTMLSMDYINFSRLNKTINAVEMISSDIITQGCELTDYRSRLDLISEEVDSNAQDFIKHEQLYKSQYNALQTKVSLVETSTTDATTTIYAHSREIQKIITRLTENETIMEVMTSNIDTNTQTDDLLLFQYRQLNSIYLQLEERVSKMETIQKTDIQTMETYITKLNQRLAIMDKHEEQTTEEVNSKMKHFENKIKQLEDNVQDLNRYNQWVLLIATNLIIISYVVYKVIYIL